jgi:hypothetical protein
MVLLEVPLTQQSEGHGQICQDTAVWVVGNLGGPHRFLCRRPPLSESAALGKAAGDPAAGEHRGQPRQAEALMQQLAVETHHVFLEEIQRPTIVPQAAVDQPQVVLCRDRKADIPQVSGNHQGTLAGREGVVWFTLLQKMDEQKGRDPSQPVLITQGLGEGCSVLQGDEHPPEFAQRHERSAQVEAEVDGLRLGVMPLWETLQRLQRLLEGRRRLMVCRLGHGPGSSLAAVGYSLVPYLTPQGVVGQSVHLLGQPVGIQLLHGHHNAGVQHPSPLLQQAAVGHLVGEGMLEGVLPLGEQARLVEELGPLELGQTAVQRLLCAVGNGLEQGQGHLMANNRRCLEQVFDLQG